MPIEALPGRVVAFDEILRPVREALERATELSRSIEISGRNLGMLDEGWFFSARFTMPGNEDYASGYGPTIIEAARKFVKDLARFTPDEEEQADA